ncbi:hypothetical protein L208DRAFT_1382341 [Tricholoma matsutake]|nr:hypothetical protein L208DRAFT_1382341 [Tricholoma matsutake 945]
MSSVPNSYYTQRIQDGVYDSIAKRLIEMGPACFAGSEYHTDFHRVIEQWSNNYLYHNPDGSKFRTNICSEVKDKSAGTILNSVRNHYPGKPSEPFRPITDDSKVKNVIVIGVPTAADDLLLGGIFNNEVGSLNAIRIEDEIEETETNLSYSVREWVHNATNDSITTKDLIVLFTSRIFIKQEGSSSPTAQKQITKQTLGTAVKKPETAPTLQTESIEPVLPPIHPSVPLPNTVINKTSTSSQATSTSTQATSAFTAFTAPKQCCEPSPPTNTPNTTTANPNKKTKAPKKEPVPTKLSHTKGKEKDSTSDVMEVEE